MHKGCVLVRTGVEYRIQDLCHMILWMNGRWGPIDTVFVFFCSICTLYQAQHFLPIDIITVTKSLEGINRLIIVLCYTQTRVTRTGYGKPDQGIMGKSGAWVTLGSLLKLMAGKKLMQQVCGKRGCKILITQRKRQFTSRIQAKSQEAGTK